MVHYCGTTAAGYPAGCPAQHNAQQALSLSLSAEDPREKLMARWWWLEAPGSASVRLVGSEALSSLVVAPSQLPQSGRATIGVEFKRFGGELAANATVAVHINGQPACRLPAGCVALDSASVPFGTPVALSAEGFADPEGEEITYSFGLIADGVFVTRRAGSASPAYRLPGLPEGSHELFACATDALGASSCSIVDVSITRPAVTLTAAAVDIAQLTTLNVREGACKRHCAMRGQRGGCGSQLLNSPANPDQHQPL